MNESVSGGTPAFEPEAKPALTTRMKRLVLGGEKNPFDKKIFHSMALLPFFAWVGLGADGLSSSSYGPQEAWHILGAYPALGLFVALAARGTGSAATATDECAAAKGRASAAVRTRVVRRRVIVISEGRTKNVGTKRKRRRELTEAFSLFGTLQARSIGRPDPGNASCLWCKCP